MCGIPLRIVLHKAYTIEIGNPTSQVFTVSNAISLQSISDDTLLVNLLEVFWEHACKLYSTENLAGTLFFIMHILEKPMPDTVYRTKPVP